MSHPEDEDPAALFRAAIGEVTPLRRDAEPAPAAPTTNSSPFMPGTVVMKDSVPSGFLRLATSLSYSPKSNTTACTLLVCVLQ